MLVCVVKIWIHTVSSFALKKTCIEIECINIISKKIIWIDPIKMRRFVKGKKHSFFDQNIKLYFYV